ncbi:MAG TPA: glycoside hydrolase family 13 protein [Anaerolineales bacterium]
MPSPFWVQDAIFYQIFPDRFANGDPANDPPNVQKWGSAPTAWGFQGGDLRGIIQHFDYLLDLGINALYLTPIFSSPSTHRYNTSDYYQIDPKLGTLGDFHALVEAAHRNNVRIILDGVFNHCGRGFLPFVDVLENGEHSPYKDWFLINRFPLDAYGPGDPLNYIGWWNHKALPKLNTGNMEVRKFIFGVARFWLEQGIDGWRLDVPNEIDDDSFWAEFRQVVRSVNRDAYLVGEIWDVNPRWTDEKHFDGLMNYPVRDALLAFLQERENAVQFSERIKQLFISYLSDNLYAMYVPLDSHDTERFKTLVGGNTDKLKLAFLFQMAFPGAPAIYYGDEIGQEGGKDPDSRRAFPWKEMDWNQDLRSWIKILIAIRKRSPSLRRGDFVPLLAEDGLYAFARTLGEEKILIALNASGRSRRFELPFTPLGWTEERIVQNLVSHEKMAVSGGQITFTLPAWSGAWIG